MNNRLTKSIAYAFPGSIMAEKLCFERSGCYFIEYTLHNIEGSDQCSTYPDEQVGGFAEIEQDLLDSFDEADGTPCPYSLKHCPHYYKMP